MSRTCWPTGSPPLTIAPDLSRFTFERYRLSRLIVAFERTLGAPAFAFAVGTRSGFVDALPARRAPLSLPARKDLGMVATQRGAAQVSTQHTLRG